MRHPSLFIIIFLYVTQNASINSSKGKTLKIGRRIQNMTTQLAFQSVQPSEVEPILHRPWVSGRNVCCDLGVGAGPSFPSLVECKSHPKSN